MEVSPGLSTSRCASSSSSWGGRPGFKQGDDTLCWNRGSSRGCSLSRPSVKPWAGQERRRGVVRPRASLEDAGEWEGSPQLQQLLVEQVRLQIGEVQVQEVVDAESNRLRSLVRDGMSQSLDRIAIRAMRRHDDMSNRVLRQLDASAQAIERDLILARKEMEAKEKEFEKFQLRAYQSQNEGLFFKGLYTPPVPRSGLSPNVAPKRGGRAASSRLRSRSQLSAAWPTQALADPPQHSSPQTRGPGIEDAGDELFNRVLYGGLALTCVSFLWSFASALLEGHFMSGHKFIEYFFVFGGFVGVKSGFDAAASDRSRD